MTEVELKKQKPLREKNVVCEFCEHKAVRLVTVGDIEYPLGGKYMICDSEICLDDALQKEVDEIEYTQSHRWELQRQDEWNFREGK